MQQLCLEVSEKEFVYSIVNRDSKAISDAGILPLTGRTPEEKKEQIKELLQKQGLLSFTDEVTLAIKSEKTTLVPQNIFGESSAQDIFRLCFGDTTHGDVDYNRFPEQGLVNVYLSPDWVKSFFVIRYPRIVIQHENTHVLRGIFNGSTFSPIVHIIPEQDYFSLFITSKNKLEFYNVFEYKAAEDIIYHAVFVLDQKEIDTKELKITIHSSGKFDTLEEEVRDKFQRIKPESSLKFDTHTKIKHQLLCV